MQGRKSAWFPSSNEDRLTRRKPWRCLGPVSKGEEKERAEESILNNVKKLEGKGQG